MPLLNESGAVGVMVDYLTVNVTGSLFLSLLSIVIVIILFAILLRLPIEWSAIGVLPLLIVCVAYYTNFLAVLGVFVIYLGVLLGKHFFITR